MCFSGSELRTGYIFLQQCYNYNINDEWNYEIVYVLKRQKLQYVQCVPPEEPLKDQMISF